jgi:flavin reductase (DIM6/NTAB) family NADH-FMN oxidoreductase RutF
MAPEPSALLDRIDTVCCVVTTTHDGVRAGCLVTYVTPASIHQSDPRVVVLLSHANLTHELVVESGVLALHVVARGQEDWVRRFGHASSRDVDKFEGVAWRAGETGVPLLDEATAWLEGRVIATMDCGDHTACLVDIVAAEVRDDDAMPLPASAVYASGIDEPRVRERFPWR